jgi:hypothetical protein
VSSASKRKLDVAFTNSTQAADNATLPQEQSHATNLSTSSNKSTLKSQPKSIAVANTNKHQTNHTTSSSQAQTTTQKVKNKSYYPNMSLHTDDASSITKNSTLSDIVDLVCETEKDGLLQYFNDNKDIKSSSKDTISLALSTVLKQVADEIGTEVLPEDHVFHAEFSRSENSCTERRKRATHCLFGEIDCLIATCS